MIIAVDFDGTCVTHAYPEVGKDIGAAKVLRELVDNNNSLILLTMRSGELLDAAVEWFKQNDIKLWGIQKNPTQHTWTSSNKVYAQLYIDDAGLGCPLKYDSEMSNRGFVDWASARQMLVSNGAIIEKT